MIITFQYTLSMAAADMKTSNSQVAHTIPVELFRFGGRLGRLCCGRRPSVPDARLGICDLLASNNLETPYRSEGLVPLPLLTSSN
jgi:hypothetical protein